MLEDKVQRTALEESSKKAFSVLDRFLKTEFSTSSAELFAGTEIHIADCLTSSGGEAFVRQGIIVFDPKKMSMSLLESESYLVNQGVLKPGDWTGVMTEAEAHAPASCLEYNILHELGHMLGDEHITGNEIEGSPTKYGKTKPKEALAEAFVHLFYGMELSKNMSDHLRQLIRQRAIGVQIQH